MLEQQVDEPYALIAWHDCGCVSAQLPWRLASSGAGKYVREHEQHILPRGCAEA